MSSIAKSAKARPVRSDSCSGLYTGLTPIAALIAPAAFLLVLVVIACPLMPWPEVQCASCAGLSPDHEFRPLTYQRPAPR